MKLLLPFALLFGAALGLAYIREIDRLDRDQDPSENGKKFFLTALAALALTLLFTLWSVDAGLILLTLTLYLCALLLGILAGQRIALAFYCKRNPGLFEKE